MIDLASTALRLIFASQLAAAISSARSRCCAVPRGIDSAKSRCSNRTSMARSQVWVTMGCRTADPVPSAGMKAFLRDRRQGLRDPRGNCAIAVVRLGKTGTVLVIKCH